MTNVAFVAPFYATTTLRFLRAAIEVPGARVGLITQEPLQKLPADLQQGLVSFARTDRALEAEGIAEAVKKLSADMGPVTRLIGVLEQLQVQLAQAREMLGIPGMSSETAENFRDKSRMKTVLRKAGVPCARHLLCDTADEAIAFAADVGFPLIVKPPAGAGARGTYRVENMEELKEGLAVSRPVKSKPVLLEEFITGREFSFDSVFIAGQPVWHSFSHYLPTPLEVLENPWIQWCVLLPRHIDHPQYEEARDIAVKAIQALGMKTGLSHMEWFLRPDGRVAISEVGARPPGAQITAMTSWAHDFSLYAAWARLMIVGEFDPPERKYAVGTAFLRGQGKGRITKIRGLEEILREIGPMVVESKLPQVGQPAGPGYEGEGFLIVRHPDTKVVEKALARLITGIRIEMGE